MLLNALTLCFSFSSVSRITSFCILYLVFLAYYYLLFSFSHRFFGPPGYVFEFCNSRMHFLHLSLASQLLCSLLFFFLSLLLLFNLNRYTCWTSWVQWSFPNLFVPPPCSLCCTIVYQLSTSFYPLIFIKVVVAMIV